MSLTPSSLTLCMEPHVSGTQGGGSAPVVSRDMLRGSIGARGPEPEGLHHPWDTGSVLGLLPQTGGDVLGLGVMAWGHPSMRGCPCPGGDGTGTSRYQGTSSSWGGTGTGEGATGGPRVGAHSPVPGEERGHRGAAPGGRPPLRGASRRQGASLAGAVPGPCRSPSPRPPPSPPSSRCPVLTSPAGVPPARRAHGPAGARPGTARHGPPRAAPGRARRPRAVPRRRRQGERGEPRRGRPGVGETPPVPSCPPCRGSPEPRRGRLRALRAPRVPCATGGRPVPAPSQETCPVLGGASGLRRTPRILCRTLVAPWSGPIPPAHRVPVSPPRPLGPAGDIGHQPSVSPWVQRGQDGAVAEMKRSRRQKGSSEWRGLCYPPGWWQGTRSTRLVASW